MQTSPPNSDFSTPGIPCERFKNDTCTDPSQCDSQMSSLPSTRNSESPIWFIPVAETGNETVFHTEKTMIQVSQKNKEQLMHISTYLVVERNHFFYNIFVNGWKESTGNELHVYYCKGIHKDLENPKITRKKMPPFLFTKHDCHDLCKIFI